MIRLYDKQNIFWEIQMRHWVLIYFFLFFVLVSFIGGCVFTTYSQFIAEGPLTEKHEVVIPKGIGLKRIAALLHKEGVISSPSVFVLGVRASGYSESIKAGEYSFPARASAKMVMNILTSGHTYVRRLVVPEGLTSAQVIALMDEAKGLVGRVSYVPKNGTLLPDTYHYSYGDTKEGMLSRMQNAMDRTLAELWDKRAEGLPLKTPQDAVILASVVEKETSLDRERGLVAGAFLNRLKQGMKLQSDPTVIYAVTDGEMNLKRRLTYKDLRYEHPYNTYVVSGLPAGPISNPGRETIEAVLNPTETDAIYFVADGKGGHVFAKTYKEHQANVRKWRNIRKGSKTKAVSGSQK